jgi:hypothetical protein
MTSDDRVCACPCKQSLEGMKPSARYATAACRTRHYRERQAQPVQTPRVTSQKRSGLQVSYQKALQAAISAIGSFAAARLAGSAVTDCEIAEQCVREALSQRQREQLDQRQEAA